MNGSFRRAQSGADRPAATGRTADTELGQEGVDVSVVLPCLNEEKTIATCVTKARNWFEAAGLRGEVLVVDNGSTDRSREEAAAAGARVVEEARRGYGAAHRRGFAESRGGVIVMADADDTYDLSDLTDLVSPLSDGFDMVVGNRLKTLSPGLDDLEPPLHRHADADRASRLLLRRAPRRQPVRPARLHPRCV